MNHESKHSKLVAGVEPKARMRTATKMIVGTRHALKRWDRVECPPDKVTELLTALGSGAVIYVLPENSTELECNLKSRKSSGMASRPLDCCMAEFLEDCRARDLSANTIRIYTKNLHACVSWLVGEGIESLDHITAGDLRRYILHLKETHNAGGVHQGYRVIKTFLRWCWLEYDLNIPNPIHKVRAPRLPKKLLNPVPMDDFAALVKVCERGTFLGDRDRSILLALLDSGCRAAEFVALDLGDVDWSSGAVAVRQGKGRKSRTTYFGAKTRREIERYLGHRRDASPDDPLWTTARGTCLTYWGLRQIIRRRALLAGVPAPSLHSFRRAFCLTMLRQGADIVSISRLLGHRDTSLVALYAKQLSDDLRVVHQRAGPVDRIGFRI